MPSRPRSPIHRTADALYSAAPAAVTLTELVERSGLSRPTAEEAALALVRAGLVTETSDESGGPRPVGRPAKRYAFRAEGGHVAGVDVGGHKVLAWCADLLGTPRGRHRIDVDPAMDPELRLEAAREALRRAVRAARVPQRDVAAVGVATAGIVGPAGVVALSADLAGWTGVDLRAELAVIGDAPVVVGNDCNLAAL
ncbi:MAG: ROK family protein, partial [Nonomuraea sp.]|nr:ROK family protein [Nonomuraea sp.]